MPSDQYNSIMAKATGLIFPQFDVASAWEVPFDITQYIQCRVHNIYLGEYPMPVLPVLEHTV